MSFLSRIAGAPEEPMIDAVARNLEVVLNAKQGYAGAVEVLGMGKYDRFVADKDLLDALMAEIVEQVRRHEPRLREPRVSVRGRDGGLWVHFTLKGRLNGETATFAVLFHSVMRNVKVAIEV